MAAQGDEWLYAEGSMRRSVSISVRGDREDRTYARRNIQSDQGVEAMKYICKHFELYELVDPTTYQQFGERAWMFFDDESLMMIDGIREYFNIPMIINNWYWHGEYQWSGLRTIDYAEGSKWSIHRLARAFDIKCRILAGEMRSEIMANQDHDLLKYVNRMEDGFGGLHVDRAKVDDGIVFFNGKGGPIWDSWVT
jgi:hypothetical protein